MLSIADALKQGVEFHRRGDLNQAEQLYRAVLEAHAQNADAWHLLGLVAHARGQQQPALECISRAIKLDGGQPTFHNHLAEVYRVLRRWPEAEQSCQQALRLKDDFAVGHNTLGVVLNEQGRAKEAARCFRRAIELDGRFRWRTTTWGWPIVNLENSTRRPRACGKRLPSIRPTPRHISNWGMCCAPEGAARGGCGGAAIAGDRSTVGGRPFQPGHALPNTGPARRGRRLLSPGTGNQSRLCRRPLQPGQRLKDLGRSAEAAKAYQQALGLNPSLAEAHFNLGVLLQNQGQVTAAISCYQRAIAARTEYPQAYNNLGTLYKAQGELARAAECYGQALEYRPNSAEALNNLGNVLKLQGRLDEAAVCYDQTLRFEPGYAQAHYNRGLMLLAAGQLAAGWEEYEWRCDCPEFERRSLDVPRWRGETLAGTLLVFAEQGLGDTLHFVRFLPEVAQRAGRVVLEVQRALVPLLKASGLELYAQLVAKGDSPGDLDAHVPLLSTPSVFGTTLEDIPAAEGYLSADAELIEQWRGTLGETTKLRVGIAWQGSPTYQGDRQRSIPLAHFAPLATGGVELVSLQKGFGAEQIAALDGTFPVRELGEAFDEQHGPFMDTAAVMKNLDLVITSDTAVAHLAGALGVPVWVALPAVPDWRWLQDREDSPWYASMRLFRQQCPGDWPEVFERLAAALKKHIAQRS